MQSIRNLSNEELVLELKKQNIWMYNENIDNRQRKRYEKELFLITQDRSPPPLPKTQELKNAYFLLDISLPQRWRPGKSILSNGTKKSTSVRFKPTELYGNDPVHPYCMEKHDRKASNGFLHASTCINRASESVEVLGQHVWMNRLFLMRCRYAI